MSAHVYDFAHNNPALFSPVAYRGRFAPTPSGPLHLGSLVTALASWLDAKANGGQWYVRIDDLDRLRCPVGMDSHILKQLEGHGLTWDGPIYRQTEHRDAYQSAVTALTAQQRCYYCQCTRALITATATQGLDGAIYDGRCRSAKHPHGALRCGVESESLTLLDAVQGRISRSPQSDFGDFVVVRNDGVIGYQLACAVDEYLMGISHVVRGADLLASTFQQQLIMSHLGLTKPYYAHIPVVMAADGRKLSKQNGAAGICVLDAHANLVTALDILGIACPNALRDAKPAELLSHALALWPKILGCWRPLVALSA